MRSFRVERSHRETAALVVGSLLAAVAIFGEWGGGWTLTVAYLLVPFFTWAALRYGVHGTAWLSLVVTLIANWFTAVGGGPFADVVGPGQSVTLLQMFLAITVSSALVLAVLVSELSGRDEVEDALRHVASHDALTGLPNRGQLAGAIDSALMFGPAIRAGSLCSSATSTISRPSTTPWGTGG